MRIDVVDPLDLTAEDIAAWRRLQAADPAFENPFLSPDWAQLCAETPGPDSRGGRVVVLREGDRAVGFLPLRLCRSTALPIGAGLSDYQALVAEPGVSVDPRALVRAVPATRLDFNHLLASQAAFKRYMRGVSSSQIVDISAGYEAYAAERKAAGHEILKDAAKKLRKLERDRGKVTFTPMSASRADFDQLLEWKRAQYRATRQTDIFEAGWPLDLVNRLLARREPGFGGGLFTMHVDGRPAAGHFVLRGGKVLHAWFIAHDAEFSRYSPGVILMDYILRWASDEGYREFDLGAGDYRFKLQLANATREVAHGFVGAALPATLLRAAQYRVRSAAEALPLGRISAWPGKAMRRVDLWRALR